jgi:hypothetical protein
MKIGSRMSRRLGKPCEPVHSFDAMGRSLKIRRGG